MQENSNLCTYIWILQLKDVSWGSGKPTVSFCLDVLQIKPWRECSRNAAHTSCCIIFRPPAAKRTQSHATCEQKLHSRNELWPFHPRDGFIKPSFQARLEIRVSPESVEFTLICGGSALLGRILRLWSFFFFNCRLSDYLKCWYFINEPVSISGSWFFLACWSQDRIDNSELCLSGFTSTAVKTQSQLLTAWLVSVSVNQTLITDRLRVQIEWKAPTLSCRKWGPRHFCNN